MTVASVFMCFTRRTHESRSLRTPRDSVWLFTHHTNGLVTIEYLFDSVWLFTSHILAWIELRPFVCFAQLMQVSHAITLLFSLHYGHVYASSWPSCDIERLTTSFYIVSWWCWYSCSSIIVNKCQKTMRLSVIIITIIRTCILSAN